MTRINGIRTLVVFVLSLALLLSGIPLFHDGMLANATGPALVCAVRVPTTGSSSISGGPATIDYSNIGEGYIMACYAGNKRAKLQITKSGGVTYTYDLKGTFEAFPLTAGNGSYTVTAFENVYGNQYAQLTGTTLQVTLNNAHLPFLYPSQYVNFNINSVAVRAGSELAAGVTDPLQVVANVYNWVIGNIKYDDNKANAALAGTLGGYLPNVDSIIETKTGICFDYAALMTAMLRSQNIPTRLEIGYVSGGVYHAWLSVYTAATGWVNQIIHFDGVNWKLMDPTFAANSGQSSQVMQFIGTGSNYSTVYTY